MKFSAKFILFVAILSVTFQCKDKEEPLSALFDIEATVISSLSPPPIKTRVVLYVGREECINQLAQNPNGDPNKKIVSSLFSCFWQDLGANSKVGFSSINIQPKSTVSSGSSQKFRYDTLFVRVEALQVVGVDTIFKTNDPNQSFIVLPESSGNETIKKSITVNLN